MADYLSDEEQVERIKRWWSENGTALVVGIALAIGGVVGWRWYDGWRTERAEEASDTYAAYLDARAGGEDTAALEERLATDFANTAYHVLAVLHRARDAVESEDWERAAELFAQGVDLASEPTVRDVARVRLARVLHQLDRHEEALATLAQVDGRGFASSVAELTGDIHWRAGALEEARAAYRAALDSAPNGQGAVLVQLKLASVPPAAPVEAESEMPVDDGAAEDAEIVAGDAAATVEDAAAAADEDTADADAAPAVESEEQLEEPLE